MEPGSGWWAWAACRDSDPAVFFGDSAAAVNRARLICRGCPVRGECLEFALEVEVPSYRFGVWGGLSARERGALGRPRRYRRAG